MRLLRTSEGPLKFQNFYDQNLPQYAILSHTWSQNPEDEVLYADVNNGTAEDKPAFKKLQACLRQAAIEGFDYCWIDTCCIDKSSSAELSEAINSMFRWYKGAGTCFAFLKDVTKRSAPVEQHPLSSTEKLSESRWFRRGWTLQELLSPKNVHFYAAEWVELQDHTDSDGVDAYLGDKISLRSTIAAVTGIDETILEGSRDFTSASIAQRMSWAANRKTSRLEDEAYCLMGLFEVNMPMLYGEGSQAFLRLQEEIIKRSDDESLFAWSLSERSDDAEYHGLFADSPQAFASCGRVIRCFSTSRPWSMTNKGLDVSLHIFERKEEEPHLREFVSLSCVDMDQVGFVAVRLVDVGNYGYMRWQCWERLHVLERGSQQQRMIYQTRPSSWQPEAEMRYAFDLGKIGPTRTALAITNDYTIIDAMFRNDRRPFTQRSDLRRWIGKGPPGDCRIHPNIRLMHPKLELWAVFLLRNLSQTGLQFILMLGLEPQISEDGPVLSFDVIQIDVDFLFPTMASYEGMFEPHYQDKARHRWSMVGNSNGSKKARMFYESKRLPGGIYFSVDLQLSFVNTESA